MKQSNRERCGHRVLTLLVQVDALRYDYPTESDAPFLWQLSREGISGVLQPSFGFEPDAAYLAGLCPDECDGCAHYWYEPEVSPFAVARYLPGFLDYLPHFPKKVFRRFLTEWVRRRTNYQYESVVNIPLNVLPFVAPVDKHLPYESAYLEQPTLFSLCEAHHISWLFHASPSSPVRLGAGLERLKRDLRPPIGFAFWHIGDLDRVGHRYGPCSPECKVAMRKVDAGIRDIFSHLESLYDRISCVVIGDHGMADVRGTVDIESALRRSGVRQERGLVYFLDSTMARFWFFDEAMRSRVEAALYALHGGTILTQKDLERYHLNYSHNRFGDLIFQAGPGILISPNYFQGNRPIKGMHGYTPEFVDQQSAFIVHSPQIATAVQFEQPVDMRRIFPTVLSLLGLDTPASCKIEGII